MVPMMFFVLVFFGGFAVAGSLVWLLSRRSLGGGALEQRMERLEAEVKRLGDEATRLELESEVHRLDEKVEFLEGLLAGRPAPGALPAGDGGGSGADPDREGDG